MSYGLPLPSGSFTPGKKLLTGATEKRIMTAFDEVYADVPANERPAVLKRLLRPVGRTRQPHPRLQRPL
ncbi:hypothetical protein OG596_09670 [Streptomyces sp. NBC_01102]|uniref:hypothetical protein n=1 Tax=Streptomyces sp. NBC_01102 TaxID=2903749 RepID=UPI00386E19C7|nr:hypothetical protein OG596_09670 [Streptomyces sp. NBC_01102]